MPMETWNRENKLAAESVRYIQRFAGIPYIWAGDDPIVGFDCSGLALEMLKRAGKVKEAEDMTAHDLMTKYMHHTVKIPMVGCLVFFGNRQRASHVGICIDEKTMIEAGGGNSETETEDDAARQNAYIKERPINRRSDILKFVDPFKT